MTLLLILAIGATVILVGLGVHVVDLIRDDGHRRTARRTPPASHPTDAFDPRSRLA
jgi:hypothetical protein